MRVFILFLACLLISLSGCGYRVGVNKPVEMGQIASIYVEMPDNRTQYPRLEAMLANHLMDNLIQDGRYKVVGFEEADSKLVTTIKQVNYRKIRSSRTDSLRPEELGLDMVVSWEVISLNGRERKELMSGSEKGNTRFYLDDNMQLARQNAFPDALARVSRQIVSTFSNAF